ncbi:MAG: hypothetical protein Q9157_002775 [Trypethelium eluteriae]
MTCQSELLTNLHHIGDTWSLILQDTGLSAAVVDDATVENLELRVPAVSQADLDDIRGSFQSQQVFPQVTDDTKRHILLNNVESIFCLIPSLKTFFENLKYLEPCCQILKRLLPMERPRTLRRELWAHYYRPESALVEYAEYDLKTHSRSTIEEERWMAYQQLWLFCLRHFPDMSTVLPRKEAKKARPCPRATNDVCWQHFGDLTVRLGFRTPEALRLQGQDPCTLLAARFLESAKAGPEKLQATDIQTVATVVRRLGTHRGSVTPPRFTTDESESGLLPIDRRQGRPFEDDYLNDRSSLFLPFLYHNLPSSRGSDITSLFVKRDFIVHFVGFPRKELTHDFHIDSSPSPVTGDSDVMMADQPCTDAACPRANRLVELETELRETREELTTQRGTAERQKLELAELARMRDHVTSLDATVLTLQKDLKDAEIREASTSASLDTRLSEYSTTVLELNTCREELKATKQDLLRRQATIDALQEELAMFKRDLRQREFTVGSLEKEIARCGHEREALQNDLIDNASRDITQLHLEETVRNLQQSKISLEQNLTQLTQNNEERCRRVEQKIASQDELNRKLQAKLDDYSKVIPEGEDPLAYLKLLQEQNSHLISDYDKLRQELNQSRGLYQSELARVQDTEDQHHKNRAAMELENAQLETENVELRKKNGRLLHLLDEPGSAVYQTQSEKLLYEDDDEDEEVAIDASPGNYGPLLDFLRFGEPQLIERGGLEPWRPPSFNRSRTTVTKGSVTLEALRILDGQPYVYRAQVNVSTFAEDFRRFYQGADASNLDFIPFESETNRQLPMVDAHKTREVLASQYDGKTISLCPRDEFREILAFNRLHLGRKRPWNGDQDTLYEERRTRIHWTEAAGEQHSSRSQNSRRRIRWNGNSKVRPKAGRHLLLLPSPSSHETTAEQFQARNEQVPNKVQGEESSNAIEVIRRIFPQPERLLAGSRAPITATAQREGHLETGSEASIVMDGNNVASETYEES